MPSIPQDDLARLQAFKDLILSYVLEIQELKDKVRKKTKLALDYREDFERECQRVHMLETKVAQLERELVAADTKIEMLEDRRKQYELRKEVTS